jgi:hypothetical protein
VRDLLGTSQNIRGLRRFADEAAAQCLLDTEGAPEIAQRRVYGRPTSLGRKPCAPSLRDQAAPCEDEADLRALGRTPRSRRRPVPSSAPPLRHTGWVDLKRLSKCSSRQSKGGRRVAISAGGPLRALLDATDRRGSLILTNTFGHPWTSEPATAIRAAQQATSPDGKETSSDAFATCSNEPQNDTGMANAF